MNVFKVLVCLSISLFFVGCYDDGKTGSIFTSYFLINETSQLLYYESSDKDSLLFDTILPPNDTLLLYTRKEYFPGVSLDNSAYFRYYDITIKDENQEILFYRSETVNCGYGDFIFYTADSITNYKTNIHYHWTIDSAYIADKACNPDLEEFLGKESA